MQTRSDTVVRVLVVTIMAHDDKTTNINQITPDTSSSTPPPSGEPQVQNLAPDSAESAAITPVSHPEDRTELIEKARSFLASPQIRHEGVSAKRRFLADKGLSDVEIDGLLHELVRPRIYDLIALECLHDSSQSRSHLFRPGHTLNLPLRIFPSCSLALREYSLGPQEDLQFSYLYIMCVSDLHIRTQP